MTPKDLRQTRHAVWASTLFQTEHLMSESITCLDGKTIVIGSPFVMTKVVQHNKVNNDGGRDHSPQGAHETLLEELHRIGVT